MRLPRVLDLGGFQASVPFVTVVLKVKQKGSARSTVGRRPLHDEFHSLHRHVQQYVASASRNS